MSIEYQIEEHEKLFLKTIRDKVKSQVRSYFQYFLGKHLLEKQYQKECKLLDPLEEEIAKRIKEIAPYHYSMMRPDWGCLFWVSNECHRFHGMEKYYEDRLGPEFSAYFTYSDFEDLGFDRDFVKRVRKKYSDIGILKINKGMGFTYAVDDKEKIIDDLTFSREYYCIRPEIERYEKMDWIFNEFSDEYLDEYFKKLILEWREKRIG